VVWLDAVGACRYLRPHGHRQRTHGHALTATHNAKVEAVTRRGTTASVWAGGGPTDIVSALHPFIHTSSHLYILPLTSGTRMSVLQTSPDRL